jgi:hypothetical protein
MTPDERKTLNGLINKLEDASYQQGRAGPRDEYADARYHAASDALDLYLDNLTNDNLPETTP